MSEIKEKEKRVRKFLVDNKLDALLITRKNNFAWFTGGANNYVALNSESGPTSILVTGDRKYVLGDNIEMPRIENEELSSPEFIVEKYGWFEDVSKGEIINRLLDKKATVGSDVLYPGMKLVSLTEIQHPLLDAEIERYKQLGKISSKCMEKIARQIRPGSTEYQVAGMLSEELYSKEIIPVVLLIAADERVFKYRHPIPTDRKIKKYAMLVLCAEKWGLIVSLTRLIHFGKLPSEIRKKQNAVVEVDASFILGSVSGRKLSEVFQCALKTYALVGYEDEWKKHHQGGPTGYMTREYKVTRVTEEILAPCRALAWNPSITGVKSEDTIIVHKDTPLIITAGHNWPMIKVKLNGKEIDRPDILMR